MQNPIREKRKRKGTLKLIHDITSTVFENETNVFLKLIYYHFRKMIPRRSTNMFTNRYVNVMANCQQNSYWGRGRVGASQVSPNFFKKTRDTWTETFFFKWLNYVYHSWWCGFSRHPLPQHLIARHHNASPPHFFTNPCPHPQTHTHTHTRARARAHTHTHTHTYLY